MRDLTRATKGLYLEVQGFSGTYNPNYNCTYNPPKRLHVDFSLEVKVPMNLQVLDTSEAGHTEVCRACLLPATTVTPRAETHVPAEHILRP